MSYSYPLAFPALTPQRMRVTPRAVVSVSVSPFTGSQQVQAHQGQWWEIDLGFPPFVYADAMTVETFLLKMNGREGTCLFGDPTRLTPRGIGTGTPLVNGAAQTGNALITDGWTATQTGILKAGDWLQLGTGSTSRLHRVLSDANSDGSGNATFDIWPNLRTSPADNAAIVVNSAKGLFRLAANDSGAYDIAEAQIYGFAFGLLEVL